MLTQTLGPRNSIRFWANGKIAGAWFPETGLAVYYTATIEDPATKVGTFRDLAPAESAIERLVNAANAGTVLAAGKDEGFNRWLRMCSAYLERHYGLVGIDDLPDWDWRDAYDHSRRVPAACEAAIEAAADF